MSKSTTPKISPAIVAMQAIETVHAQLNDLYATRDTLATSNVRADKIALASVLDEIEDARADAKRLRKQRRKLHRASAEPIPNCNSVCCRYRRIAAEAANEADETSA